MSKDRLLSDDELIQEIDVITDNLLAYGIGAKDSYDTRIFDLINTQKRLYAESVIGEDEPYLEEPTPAFEGAYDATNQMIEAQNILRAEQREMIK